MVFDTPTHTYPILGTKNVFVQQKPMEYFKQNPFSFTARLLNIIILWKGQFQSI